MKSCTSILIDWSNVRDLKKGDKIHVGAMGHLGEATVIDDDCFDIEIRYEDATDETSTLRYKDLCDGESYLHVYGN